MDLNYTDTDFRPQGVIEDCELDMALDRMKMILNCPWISVIHAVSHMA